MDVFAELQRQASLIRQLQDVFAELRRQASLIRQLQGALGGNQIVAGTVSAAGGVVSGTGFTSAKTGTGTYTVTFSPAFASAPGLGLSPGTTSGQDARWDSLTAAAFVVTTFLSSPVTVADSGFSFVAVGPP